MVNCNDLGSAMSGLTKCAAGPATRRIVRVDQVDSSRAGLGQQLQVNLGGVPVRDSKGRYAHVRGIYLDAKLRATTVDDNVAITAHMLKSIWQNIRLSDVTGHTYFDGSLDGRDITDDAFFRHWADQQWPFMTTGTQAGLPATNPMSPTKVTDYGIAADKTPGTVDHPVSLYMPLATNGKGNPLQGIIPIASLQRAGAGALQIQIGVRPLAPLTQTGVTFVNLIRTDGQVGLDVWLDLVYLDDIVTDAPWELKSYTKTESSLILDDADRVTEYAVVRFHEEDAPGGQGGAGLGQAANITIGTVEAAGFSEFAGYPQSAIVTRGMLYYASDSMSAIQRANAKQDLPMLSATGTPEALILFPYRQREFAPAGPISLNLTRSGTFVRFLHRTVGCQTRARVEKTLQAAQCGSCAFYGSNANGGLTSNVTSSAPIIAKPLG